MPQWQKQWDHRQLLKTPCSIELWTILSDNCDQEQCYRTCALQYSAPPCLSSARMTICWYHLGADEHMAAFWAYRDRSDSRWEPNRLAWHDWHGVTRGQRAVGACGGPGTALPDNIHAMRYHPWCYAVADRALAKTVNSVDVSPEC